MNSTTAELETALAGLRHSRHGYYGPVLRDRLLRSLAAGGVAARDYRVLRLVDAEPAGTVTVGHVAELLMCDRARASRVVHGLADTGVLTLRPGVADARRRELALTPAGQELLARAASARLAHLDAILVGWDVDDVHMFARLVTRLTEAAGRHPLATRSC